MTRSCTGCSDSAPGTASHALFTAKRSLCGARRARHGLWPTAPSPQPPPCMAPLCLHAAAVDPTCSSQRARPSSGTAESRCQNKTSCLRAARHASASRVSPARGARQVQEGVRVVSHAQRVLQVHYNLDVPVFNVIGGQAAPVRLQRAAMRPRRMARRPHHLTRNGHQRRGYLLASLCRW